MSPPDNPSCPMADDPPPADACAGSPVAQAEGATGPSAGQLKGELTLRAELIANIPYAAMTLLGSAVLLVCVGGVFWRWLSAGLYLAYGLAGAFWVMLFICPYCRFHGTRQCPCGYGRIAARLRPSKNGDGFARQFRRHIPVIVPIWFIPLIAGGIGLLAGFSWVLVGLMLVFAVDSFVVLPLVSTRYSCARCPQKSECPWTGRRCGGG